jgi:SAM-dependent methyltransferase
MDHGVDQDTGTPRGTNDVPAAPRTTTLDLALAGDRQATRLSGAWDRVWRWPVLRGLRYRWISHRQEWEFKRQFHRFVALPSHRPQPLPVRWEDRRPYLFDRTLNTEYPRDYIYHCAWAARALAGSPPDLHVDVGSSLYFVTIVSAFVQVKFYDLRPAGISLSNFSSGRADLTSLPFDSGSIESLSCLHVVEHVGLGRYGDPLDPDGDVKAMRELARVLRERGRLLFAVPVGRPRVDFNAHRVYALDQIVASFAGLRLLRFALVPDDPEQGGLIDDAPPELVARQEYGCGCFEFTKDPG